MSLRGLLRRAVHVLPAGAPRESSTSYDDFVDSHFVLPQPGYSRGAA